MDRFSFRVFKSSCEKRLIRPGDKLIVSLSGGIDSMSLFCLLLIFQKRINLDIHLVHFNHGLREESSKEEAFLRELADAKSVPLTVFRATHLKGKSGAQLKAREWRYQKLNEIQRNLSFDKIALGHHLDDLIETQIWRLLRGASLFSLNPIQDINLPYIRPLLRFRKDELKSYLISIDQSWCEDQSNYRSDYTRNLIRNQLMPLMRNSAGGRFEEKMLSLNDDAQKLRSLFEEQAQPADYEVDELAYHTILALSPLLAAELIHRFLIYHGQTEVSRAQIEGIHRLTLSGRGNWRIALKNGQIVMGKNKMITVRRLEDAK